MIQIDLKESEISLKGLPYANARPKFQGVILNFKSKHGFLQYGTDTFDDWQCNLRAIALGLEALRKVDRYGITKRGEQYTGFKVLPESTTGFADIQTAAEFIAKHSGYMADDIIHQEIIFKDGYRKAALRLHPDKGGDNNEFCLLQKAKEIFEKAG